MLVLAFDTATDVATSALVADGARARRAGRARRGHCSATSTSCSRSAGSTPADLDALVVGTGPAASRARESDWRSRGASRLALEIPGAGVSTLDALAASQPGAYPVIDARRQEVFVAGPRALSPDDLELEPGTLCVGSGAVRYRATIERRGAVVPPDDDDRHVPHARLHVSLARDYARRRRSWSRSTCACRTRSFRGA